MQKFLTSLEDRLKNKKKEPDPTLPRYAGLHVRMFANLIDSLALLLITMPFFSITPTLDPAHMPANTPPEVVEAMKQHQDGHITQDEFEMIVAKSDFFTAVIVPTFIKYTLMTFIFMGIIYISFWKYTGGTPGKWLFKIKIVDEKTLGAPSLKQYILRFIGYVFSMVPLCLGFAMISMNKRRKGLHDFIAGTIVVYTRPLDSEWEKKKLKYQAYIMVVILVIAAIYLSTKQ